MLLSYQWRQHAATVFYHFLGSRFILVRLIMAPLIKCHIKKNRSFWSNFAVIKDVHYRVPFEKTIFMPSIFKKNHCQAETCIRNALLSNFPLPRRNKSQRNRVKCFSLLKWAPFATSSRHPIYPGRLEGNLVRQVALPLDWQGRVDPRKCHPHSHS